MPMSRSSSLFASPSTIIVTMEFMSSLRSGRKMITSSIRLMNSGRIAFLSASICLSFMLS